MAHARRAITFDTPEVLTLLRSLHCMKSREDYSTLDGRQLSRATDVCFGSQADIMPSLGHVRFAPEADMAGRRALRMALLSHFPTHR